MKGWYRDYEQRLDLCVRYTVRTPKYSEDQKQAALEHYRTHDRCISATMRALGYPDRGTLTAWVREAFSGKVVQRLMKQERLLVAGLRRRRFGSYLGEISAAPENLINRDFHAKAPNVKWLTDITEFQIPAGKVYLSPIIDCFDGMVISWSIGTQPDAELVNTMLDAAIETVTDSAE